MISVLLCLVFMLPLLAISAVVYVFSGKNIVFQYFDWLDE